MTQPLTPQRQAADALAVANILAVRPQLTGLARASDPLALRPLELLHAGPPLPDPCRPCVPILNAAVAAALFEKWAPSEAQARDMVLRGDIALQLAAAPAIPQGTPEQAAAFIALWPADAETPGALLGEAHLALTHTRPRLTVNTLRAVVRQRQQLVSLGVLDKTGQAGRLGGGFYRVPSALFERAEAGLDYAH